MCFPLPSSPPPVRAPGLFLFCLYCFIFPQPRAQISFPPLCREINDGEEGVKCDLEEVIDTIWTLYIYFFFSQSIQRDQDKIGHGAVGPPDRIIIIIKKKKKNAEGSCDKSRKGTGGGVL